MKFKEFDQKMRVYEEAHDHCVLPGLYMVARIDGRNFTTLTKDVLLDLDRPFDIRFQEWMSRAAQRVMDCGFRTLYAYIQSDEISLLLHPKENSFDRKLRKLDSILAAEAAAAFCIASGAHGAFDCRISQLPRDEDVVDYFRWRQADAPRNARNAYVYWTLRDDGRSGKQADREMRAMSYAEKGSFLHDSGIMFDDLPGWQTRGQGISWETYEKEGMDPRTGEKKLAQRKRLKAGDLPTGDAYGDFLFNLEMSA